MFTLPQKTRRWNAAHVLSFGVHAVLVIFLLYQPRPRFLQPRSVMAGFGGTSTSIVYLPSSARLGDHAASDPHHALVAPVHRAKPKQTGVTAKAEGEHAKGDDVRSTLAGMPYGSLGTGPAYGHDIRPALPTVFPDPVVGTLPPGVRGDVVVQVTIDSDGKITETKVLRGLGYGVEERVLAALQDWRFRPATQDGVAIPSQQYMYFHFPS